MAKSFTKFDRFVRSESEIPKVFPVATGDRLNYEGMEMGEVLSISFRNGSARLRIRTFDGSEHEVGVLAWDQIGWSFENRGGYVISRDYLEDWAYRALLALYAEKRLPAITKAHDPVPLVLASMGL